MRIYEEIVKDIENDINSGIYRAGKRIPSVRELSRKYNCSKNTVVKAFETLKSSHIIYSVPQSGYYIVENAFKNNPTADDIINFSTGNQTIGSINTPDLKHCLDIALDIYKNNSLNSNIYGVDSLREILPEYLSDFQVFTRPDNIFVNLGVQQALTILTKMPFPNGKNVILVEQPTFRYYIDFLKSEGADVIGIERSENGIDLNKLESIFKNSSIKFFYTIPRNHSPLGTCYNKNQRKAIAELANKYDVYIVEDDYFGDISPDPKYDPIYAYSDHCHIIYLKSFSKIVPWMRIGLTLIPSHMLNMFKEYRHISYYFSYFSASLISQAALEIFIRSKILKKHTSSLSKELEKKQRSLQKSASILEKYGVRHIGGKSGLYSYLQLPDYINEDKLIRDLKMQNVLLQSGKKFYLDDFPYKKGLRISIASTSIDKINKGFEIINQMVKKQTN